MIEAEHLSKTFRVARRRPGLSGALRGVLDPAVRHVEAVQDLSLRVARGEMVGLVGPNGAGKSTTIKMLTGILVPTGGDVHVAGLNPVRQRENLARLRGMLDLDEFLDTPVRQLSLGQRMRGDLAAALLHEPELLYLDEPTIGLDVVAKARIREFLLAINAEQGVTVLLTTHDMDDVEMLCPRMVIIDHGRKLYDGTDGEIRERFGGERTLIAVLDAAEIAAIARDAQGQPVLGELPEGVRQVQAEAPRIWLSFGRDALPAHELVAWLGARYRLRDVTFQEPEIEDVIRRIYEEGLLLTEAIRSKRVQAA